MRGKGFEPSDGLTDRISYLHISVGLILNLKSCAFDQASL